MRFKASSDFIAVFGIQPVPLGKQSPKLGNYRSILDLEAACIRLKIGKIKSLASIDTTVF